MQNIENLESCPEKNKKEWENIEAALWNRLRELRQFKDLQSPCAILSCPPSAIVVGVPQKLKAQIDYNYSAKLALEEALRAVFNKENVRIVVQAADKECQEAKKRIDGAEAAREKEEKIRVAVERQKAEGKCNIVPFPAAEDKIRTELTLERHSLFVSNTFKGDIWVHERRVNDPTTGEAVIQRVQVGDPLGQVRGVLKQKHQAVLYEFLKIWGEQEYGVAEHDGRHYGCIKMSVYDLVVLLTKSDAAKDYRRVRSLLRAMATIPVEIENGYIETGESLKKGFTLLNFEWEARRFDTKTKRPINEDKSEIRIMFSSFLTESFLRKNIKQFLYGEYQKLKSKQSRRSGLEELLYGRFDLQLAGKEEYNIALKNLPKEFGTPHYERKSGRKRAIEPALKRLNGRLIVGGKHRLAVFLKESSDGQDFVLVAKRTILKN